MNFNILTFPPYDFSVTSQDLHTEKSGVDENGYTHTDTLRKDKRAFNISWRGTKSQMTAIINAIEATPSFNPDWLPKKSDVGVIYKGSYDLKTIGWNGSDIVWELSAEFVEN